MSAIALSDEEVAATVVSVEGGLVDEGEVMSSEEAEVVSEADGGTAEVGVSPTCCRFAGRFPSVNSDTFNSFMEAVLTDEFRK